MARKEAHGQYVEDGTCSPRLSRDYKGSDDVVVGQCHGTNVGEMGALRRGNGNVTGGVPFMAFDWQQGGESTEMFSNTLNCTRVPGVLPFDTIQVTSKANRSRPKPGDPCHPLAKGAHAPAITLTLQASGAGTSRPGGPRLGSEEDYHPVAPVPRRLTPTECERLQGFPDNWTARGVDEGGEPVEMADTPRYRMMGNAVSVPVAAWIGRRIVEAEESWA